MSISRRGVVVGGASLGALSVLGACDGSRGSGPQGSDTAEGELSPWSPAGSVDAAAFAWGVQVGDATANAAVISVRTLETRVVLVLARATCDAGVCWDEVERTEALEVSDRVLQLTLDGLDADSEYSVVVYAQDGERRSPVTRFRTALPADGWRVVTFGATCCLGGNEPWPSLSYAAAEQLDFFCLAGDTIYADNPPDAFDLDSKWATALATQGLLDLTASTSIIAAWDDHEVDNNWSYDTAGMEETVQSALAEFRRALPQTIGPGSPGVWRKLAWGQVCDVFVLDCRGERRDGSYVSVEQMDWLKAGLASSTARFKIILNTVPITDYAAFWQSTQIDDRWSGFPAQRSEILQHIAGQDITGVLWISGDLHMAQIGYVDPAGGVAADQWEVLVGPAGSFPNVLANMYAGDPQYPVLFAFFNWTRFVCDPDAGTIAVTFIGDDGAVIAERVLAL